ncbi:MAG TPA: sialidase family protein [Chloroflexia bacterium]|nr:sialidase family protein [Chloroflexia bacterium]
MRIVPSAHWRLRLGGFALAIFTLLFSTLGAAAQVPLALVRVSTDPYTNTSSMHQTEVEPDTFSYGTTIVSAFQVGRFSDGGSSNIGWATSTDSGITWVNGFLPGITIYGTPPGPYQRVSDASVAYDALHGVWMVVSLPLNGPGAGLNTVVNRSTNGGTAWLSPVTLVTQGGLDKTWIACDDSTISPYYGHCYAEWDNNSGGNIMQMTTSTDGGLTWGGVQTPAGSPSGLGGQPVVQPNGTVVVPYSANNSAIRSFVSTNGGTSWSGAATVSSVSTHGVAGNLRTSPLPSAEVDPGGRVYVAWQDCRFRAGCPSNDIVISSSTDGLTWSAVTRIPIDAVSSTVDHFIPGLAVDQFKRDPIPRLALTYYYYPVAACSSATCQLSVGFVSSLDGGATWTPPTPLAGPITLTWLPLTNQGYMVGDYISTSFSADDRAHPVFAVANAPSGSVFDSAMYTPVPGLFLRTVFPALSPLRPVRAGGDKPVFFAPSDRPLPMILPTAY